jgi:hypothetical protein
MAKTKARAALEIIFYADRFGLMLANQLLDGIFLRRQQNQALPIRQRKKCLSGALSLFGPNQRLARQNPEECAPERKFVPGASQSAKSFAFQRAKENA